MLVHFAPLAVDPAALTEALCAVVPIVQAQVQRRWLIPITYDGQDLHNVAAHVSRTPETVILLHASVEYTVACLGFAPGFAYLNGLPPELHIPRRSAPRAEIPAGSLILGGQQTAVMPLALPSGWHVLGRCDVPFFDAARAPPSLLQPGDRVRFIPTEAALLSAAPLHCEVVL